MKTYTAKQAAHQLGISAKYLGELARKGRVPVSSATPGGYRRYTDADIRAAERYLNGDKGATETDWVALDREHEQHVNAMWERQVLKYKREWFIGAVLSLGVIAFLNISHGMRLIDPAAGPMGYAPLILFGSGSSISSLLLAMIAPIGRKRLQGPDTETVHERVVSRQERFENVLGQGDAMAIVAMSILFIACFFTALAMLISTMELA